MILKKLTSAVLAGLMIFQMSLSAFAHDNCESDDENTLSKITCELQEKRTENTKSFELSDGQLLKAEYPIPVHCRDENGVWQDIYSESQSESNLKFSEHANSENIVSVSNRSFSVSWGYEGCERSEKRNVEESEIKYENIYENIDLEYKITKENLKENVILNSKDAQNEFEIVCKIGDLKAFQQDDKTIALLNSNEKAVFKISAPEMIDSKNEKSNNLSLKIEDENGGKLRLKLICDKEWLENEERAYPVTIDPDYKDEYFEFNVSLTSALCTNYRKKDTKSSLFLDLRGSDFKDIGVISVSIYGRKPSGEELNCTNRAQYYFLEAGKKYELWNTVNEDGCNEVQIRFFGHPNQRVYGKWSPDYSADSQCLRIGDPFGGTNGNTTDRAFNYYVISPQGACWTTIRTKANSSSVYLNLESCRGGTVNVTIFGIGGSSASENCTYNTEQYTLELGKKYELWNTVRERGHFAVQLRFAGTPATHLIGRWSPDYSPESGCVLVNGNYTVPIRAVSSWQKLIDVPQLSQLGEFPTGCELVSAVMLLKFYGYDVSVREFIDKYLEKRGVSEHPDPNSAFVGSPYTKNSYGCFAPCVAKAMNKILSGDYAAVIRGKTLKTLSDEYIQKNIPLIVWVTMGMRETRPTTSWTIDYIDENARYKKGDKFTWPGNEHCVVLLGFSEQDYFVNDPLQPLGKVRGAYAKSLMEKRFKEQGSQAVVVLKSTPKVHIVDYTSEIQKKLDDEHFVFFKYRTDILMAPLNVKPCYIFNALKYFFEQVTHNGPWDVKRNSSWENKFPMSVPSRDEQFKFHSYSLTKEDLGNLTYGYLGTALGLHPKTLYIGGGAANKGKNIKEMIAALICDSDLYTPPYYGDDPNDHTNVERGIELYKTLNPDADRVAPSWDIGELSFLAEQIHDKRCVIM